MRKRSNYLPKPATDKVTISSNIKVPCNKFHYKLIDTLGNIVHQQYESSNFAELDISSLNQGVYVYQDLQIAPPKY
ncbi:MAG: T9SS type A sorting domain-containing protein [Flavobacteriales bacterium]|nr:T9SS type A sorting domain-containing protein [Flavobacteriales bacterium]